MRSIIDEIAQAEAEAERIRTESAANAKELIQSAKKQAEAEDKLFEEKEHDAFRKALSEAEKKGSALSDEILEKAKKEAEEFSSKASAKIPEAVNYIIGKVRESV